MKRFLAVMFLAGPLFATTVFRVDPPPVMTTAGIAPPGGYPVLHAVSGAVINVCSDAACATPQATYSDVSGASTCPVGAPVVPAGTATCTSTTDLRGNFGFWLPASSTGAVYYYKVILPSGVSDGVSYGPYPIQTPPAVSSALPYDIRGKGAVCGTEVNTAVQAAITAGFKNILIPAGCTWTPPLGFIPGGLHFVGEQMATSVIQSATNPATTTLTLGPGSFLDYLSLNGNTCNLPTNCQVAHYENTSDITVNVVSTGYGAYHSVGGVSGLDVTPAFFQVERGLGDAFNGSTGSIGQGGGNAGRLDCYPSGAGCLFIGRFSNVPGIQINDYAPTGGVVPTSGNHLSFFTTGLITGSFIQANQRTSTMTAAAQRYDMADISGTFTGPLLVYNNAGVNKVTIQNNGSYTTPGTINLLPKSVTLVNGANNHAVAGAGSGVIAVSGPSGAFALGGLSAPVTGNGSVVWIINNTGQIMTITHQDGSAAAGDRFYNPAGADFVCAHGFCAVQAVYNGQWLLLAPTNN